MRFKVPRTGIEPARIAPQVFETSASTYSAIWASSAKIPIFHHTFIFLDAKNRAVAPISYAGHPRSKGKQTISKYFEYFWEC